MKQFEKAYKKCRAKLPNRHPDEIDFGLGFRAALKLILERLEDGGPNIPVHTFIERELQ